MDKTPKSYTDKWLDDQIQNGFDKAYRHQAPDGVWECIVPDINAPLEQGVKDAFDALPKKKAPNHIWASIDNDLNANVENTTDAEIKEAFDDLPKRQAPAHVWGAIESALIVSPEALIDGDVKDAFDALPPKKAPDLWNNIEKEIGNDASSVIDEQVKNSFDQLSVKKAPSNLWSKIESSIVVDTDQILDDKIKEGFTKNKGAAPERAWHTVSKQLTIDKAWNGVSKVLDDLQARESRRRVWTKVAAASILMLLWWRGCGDAVMNFGNTPADAVNHETNIIASNEDGTSVSSHNSNDFHLNSQNQYDITNGGLTTSIPSDRTSTNDERAKNNGNYVASGMNGNNANTNSNQNNRSNSNQPNSSQGNNSNIGDNHNSGDSFDGGFPNHLVQGTNGNILWNTTPNYNPLDLVVGLNNWGTVTAPSDPSIATIDVDNGSDEITDIGIVDITALSASTLPIDEEGWELKKAQKEPKDLSNLKWEFGAVYEMNTMLLWNSETKEGFDEQSLVSTQLQMSSAYGLAFQYNINQNHALQANTFVLSEVNQDYRGYWQGRYYERKVQMDYSKFALSYQYNVGKQGHQGLIRVGGYASYLRMRQEQLANARQAWTLENTDEYSRLDYGLRAALGYRYAKGRWAFELGIHGEMGMKNIFLGSATIPAEAMPTRLRGIGAFVGIRYRW